MNNQWDLGSEVETIVEFRDKRDWKQYNYPKDLAAAISIEAAELQELFLWRGQELPDQIATDSDRMNDISDEIADVAIYLLLLAHDFNLDLREAIIQKIRKNELKYPLKDML